MVVAASEPQTLRRVSRANMEVEREPPAMENTSFKEASFFPDLGKIDAWLSQRGFKNNDRLRNYRTILSKLVCLEESGGRAAAYEWLLKRRSPGENLSAFMDGWEIVDALKCLRAEKVEVPDELLKRALGGPKDASQENSNNNQGRNATFELTVGAMVARQNLHPVLSTGNPDVEFRFEDRRVLIECKRVLEGRSAMRTATEGIRQLRKQVRAADCEVGIVAVNISREFYRGDRCLEVLAGTEPREALYERISLFIDAHREAILGMNCEAAAGAFFYAAAPFRLEDGRFMLSRAGTFCPFDVGGNEFLGRLAQRLYL